MTQTLHGPKYRIKIVPSFMGRSYQVEKKGWYFWNKTHLCKTEEEALLCIAHVSKKPKEGTIVYVFDSNGEPLGV